MKRRLMCVAVLAWSCGAAIGSAAELKSGLAAGEKIPAFHVLKVAGADGDGVEVGKELCYRCKYGPRPQVMIFTRTVDGRVAALAEKLNAAVAANEAKQLSAFVNVLNADKAAAEQSAKQLAGKIHADKLPIVVPLDNADGPKQYALNPEAEVTVLVANESTVVASRGYAAGQFDDAALNAVLADVAALVK